MLSSRIIFWTLFALAVAAGLLFVNQFSIVSTGVFSAAAVIALVFVYSVNAQVKKFSGNNLHANPASLSDFFSIIERKCTDQQNDLKQIVLAIERVGTTEAVNMEMLNREVGQAIVSLQNKLAAVKEVEEQRVWAAQCIASLSEIRKDNAELTEYSYQVISRLVKFLGANQGAFYVMTDEEKPVLELLSTYAYNKRKYNNEKIVLEPGTGLVGQCALEREMILLTDVPKDYIRITSGLGEALPRCVAIVPLIFRDQIFGVIEVASFQKLKTHQLEFINKACETVALELSGIRTQERTRRLLEQSREEELKQNLEEMKVTQQKMLMKEDELSRQLVTTQRAMAMAEAEQKKNEAILEGCMDAVISFNQMGDVEYFNKAAEEVFGIARMEVIGKSVENLLKIRIVEGEEDFKVVSSTGNEVTLRTEINAVDHSGEIISLLLTATKVKIGQKHLFTLFAQKVSVDLF